MGVEWRGDELVTTEVARDASGRFALDPEVAERDRQAMRMRANGRTYQEIADALGYANRAAAKNQIERYYRQSAKPDALAYREEMDQQLDELYRAVVDVLEAKHLKVVNGAVVFDPTTGGLMEDDAPVLRAADTALRVLARRAALHGIDAPAKVQALVQNVRVTVDGAEDV